MKREQINGHLDDIERALRGVFTSSSDEDEAFDNATRSLDSLRDWVNGTHPGTSVPADSDDQQNVGSKPEDEKKCLCGKPAGHRKMGF